jgi:hypothetical protein
MTQMQADATIRKAIRSSSEGVIFLPSRKAEQVYELPRLNEIAQNLRRPAAACFLERALETMEHRDGANPDDPAGYDGVPDGQVKLRARIGPGGNVLQVEVLESGFDDETVPACVSRAVKKQHFPQNQSGNNHHIDIVYWVSLGMQAAMSREALAARVRRERVEAAIRAKPCLQGRVRAGSYTVEGLNLVGPGGATMANRIDQSSLPADVRKCVAQAFRGIRLPADAESFVRPVSPAIRFDVGADGTIAVQDEQWLELVKLEERAAKAERRAELTGGDAVAGGDEQAPPTHILDGVDRGEPPAPTTDTPAPQGPPAEPAPGDPGKGGIKLDLGGRTDEPAPEPSP